MCSTVKSLGEMLTHDTFTFFLVTTFCMITLPCQPGWTPLGWGYFGHKVDKMSYSYDFAPGKLVAFDGSHVRDSSWFGSITEHVVGSGHHGEHLQSLLSCTSNIGNLFHIVFDLSGGTTF